MLMISTQMFRTQFEGDVIFFTQGPRCPVSLLYFGHFFLVFNLKYQDSLSVSLIIMLQLKTFAYTSWKNKANV